MGNKDTNLKTGADKRFHFDLEEEDDMAMADQAPDEIDDFILRLTLGTKVKKSFETKSVVSNLSSA